MPTNPRIHAAELPDSKELKMDFLESSFFNATGPRRCLPSPAEVRALSGTDQTRPQPRPVKFEHLSLIVKFGPHVTVSEAQCLWAIKRVLCDEVPVPEVYGWRVDGRDVFIYMQLVRGETLEGQWDSLSTADRIIVCEQLRRIVTSLRKVEQDPNDSFVGSLSRQQLLDIVFEGQTPGGPFATIKQFNDWFSRLPWHQFPNAEDIQDPYRAFLPDTGTIKLTHGDLHQGNIIISSTRPPHILAIVDWAHSGWYPDFWEYCKAAYTCSYDGEWRNEWIPKILDPRPEVHEVFAEYTMALGALDFRRCVRGLGRRGGAKLTPKHVKSNVTSDPGTQNKLGEVRL